ncbi:AAA-like domain-containing protein [Capilliphycus salinus ALCB114379]|uniref:AAA-like domain-containing protein n=1 Tax=Capilliphycus salinus TaxID=2768948 RepID=UPI0039A5FADB
MFLSQYQVGGSLKFNDPSYVIRSADSQLYAALKSGEFCSVFEARQMGKSSLLVRIKCHLEADGCCCISLDMSSLSDPNITHECWYKRLLYKICLQLDLLEKIQFNTWWKNHQILKPVGRLHQLLREILTVYIPDNKLIFLIDEVDSLLNLPFSVDDFFSLIQFYSERRAAIEYNRLAFAVFGVTTPSDLVKNRLKSPFFGATEIRLSGFKPTEIQPLIQPFEGKVFQPHRILKQILLWTNGQPFLTQKLCKIVWQIIQYSPHQQLIIPEGQEELWITKIVHYFILKDWEFQDEPEHLRTIENRIIYNDGRKTQKLLRIYQQILQGFDVKADKTEDKTELLLSGLVVEHRGLLKVKNLIYRHVFNLKWVENKLSGIQQLNPQELEPQSVFNKSSFSSS